MRYSFFLTAPDVRSLVWVVAAVGALGASPALAERCDGPPSAAELEDTQEKSRRYCITVSKVSAGGWTLLDDRKTVPIQVPINDTADLIFMIDRDFKDEARLSALSIRPVSGSTPPGEFEGESGHKFDTGSKFTLPGNKWQYKVKNKNVEKGDYDYTVYIRLTSDNKEVEVDPRIKNGGRSN